MTKCIEKMMQKSGKIHEFISKKTSDSRGKKYLKFLKFFLLILKMIYVCFMVLSRVRP